ncbi:MAG TPA: tripartite tricarboxylate transporter TctB family protein [Beijerinckiaceae bacterium]|jgi:putative tricarboxylic transport membrane protein
MADELPLLPHEERLAPRTDLWVAASFLVFSAAILVLSFRMPTYTDQGGQIYTAPGLVPSFYGVVIGILSLWLAARSIRAGALAPAGAHHGRPDSGNSNARFALAAALGVIFIVGLIGRMPFWIAAAVFVTLFVAAFEWQPGLSRKARLRRLATALVQGVATGILVTLVFERVFLVRLP